MTTASKQHLKKNLQKAAKPCAQTACTNLQLSHSWAGGSWDLRSEQHPTPISSQHQSSRRESVHDDATTSYFINLKAHVSYQFACLGSRIKNMLPDEYKCICFPLLWHFGSQLVHDIIPILLLTSVNRQQPWTQLSVESLKCVLSAVTTPFSTRYYLQTRHSQQRASSVRSPLSPSAWSAAWRWLVQCWTPCLHPCTSPLKNSQDIIRNVQGFKINVDQCNGICEFIGYFRPIEK